MKKQILSILLMLVAIAIAGKALYWKEQGNTANAHKNGQNISHKTEVTPQIGTRVITDATSDTRREVAATSPALGSSDAVPSPAPDTSDAKPSAVPGTSATGSSPTDTSLTGSSPAGSSPAGSSPADPSPAKSSPAKPSPVPHTPTPSPAPTASLTNVYHQDILDALLSIGLAVEDINTMANMGITNEEISSVISVVNITPDMVAEFDKYKDIWANASDMEKKLMIELLKQVAGK